MDKNKIMMKSFAILILLIITITPLSIAQDISGAGIYFDPNLNQLTINPVDELGQPLQQATPAQMDQATNSKQFLSEKTSWHTATQQQQDEYLNHKNPNINIEGAGNMDHSFDDNNNILSKDGVNQDLNNFQDGTEIKITENDITSDYDGGSVKSDNGIATFENAKDNPLKGCLDEDSQSFGKFNIWDISEDCIANPEGGEEGLEFNFQPSESSQGTLSSLTNNFLVPLVSAQQQQQPQPALGGGGAIDPEIAQLMQMVQQIMAGLQPFFDAIRNNNQGQATVAEEAGGVAIGYDERAALALERQKQAQGAVQQAELAQPGKTISNSNVFAQTNSQTILKEQGVSRVGEDETTTILNGIEGNSNFAALTDSEESEEETNEDNNNVIVSAILSLLSNIPSVDAQTSSQSIELSGHNININGHDIEYHTLKTYDNLEGAGQRIEFNSGKIKLKFQGQRLLYSRLITNAPYGIKRVTNKLDINQNRYTLQHYTNKLGKLYDEDHIVSVGDITTELNEGRYRGLKINRERLSMFQNIGIKG